MAEVVTRRRKQRADVACDFCRRRKLGCNNAKPRCENCVTHAKECTYKSPVSTRSGIDRGSSTRLQLEQHPPIHTPDKITKAQQKILYEKSLQAKTQQVAAAALPPGTADPSTVEATRPSSSQLPAAAPDLTIEAHGQHYHGPTSAMFDGQEPRRSRSVVVASTQDMEANASHKMQLLAGAVIQRQHELVNLRAGKFDFDGTDPQLAMVLLSVFWNRQHAAGSIVYRPCFMRDMATRGPYYSPLLLNAIFFAASKHASGLKGLAAPGQSISPFRQKVNALLDVSMLCTSSITTVQALLIMADALFSWCDERSLSWHYLGLAISMIIDMGIHFESTVSKTPEEIETRRRLFWAAFVLDKVQSIYQGRPARLRYADCNVPMVFLDEFEELEPFDTVGYAETAGRSNLPTHAVTTFTHLCKLSTIADRILGVLYSGETSRKDGQQLREGLVILSADLEFWKSSLPKHLAVDIDEARNLDMSPQAIALPHTVSLMLMFHALIILLNRPFVSEGHLETAGSIAQSAITTCRASADKIDGLLRYYRSHWCIKSPPYFASYATYVSATIHARVAAKSPANSLAHVRLRTCLEILSSHQTVCHAPRRALAILLQLVRRLRVDVGDQFVASLSRTAMCDASSAISSAGIGAESQGLARGQLIEMSGALAEPSVVVLPDASQANVDIGHEAMEWDNIFSDNLFEIDPLFGWMDIPLDPSFDISL